MLVALIVTGCSWSPTQPSPTPLRVRGAEIVVRAGSAAAPDGCSPADVANIVQSFLVAFNDADEAAMAKVVNAIAFSAPNPPPQGFVVVGSRRDLMAYVSVRHARHGVQKLLDLDMAYATDGDRVDFGYHVERNADDLHERVPGKGYLRCATRLIYVWNIGGPTPS